MGLGCGTEAVATVCLYHGLIATGAGRFKEEFLQAVSCYDEGEDAEKRLKAFNSVFDKIRDIVIGTTAVEPPKRRAFETILEACSAEFDFDKSPNLDRRVTRATGYPERRVSIALRDAVVYRRCTHMIDGFFLASVANLFREARKAWTKQDLCLLGACVYIQARLDYPESDSVSIPNVCRWVGCTPTTIRDNLGASTR